MHISSFRDAIYHTTNYTVARLTQNKDLFSGDIEKYECIIDQNEVISSFEITTDGAKKFKARLLSELNEVEQVVIIDEIREKIYTNIKKNKFLDELASNVGDYNYKQINEELPLQVIFEEAYPNPKAELPPPPFGCIIL